MTTTAPRLIIVDDEAPLREMLADYLGRHGFAVRTADSGHALDACLAEEPIDLVLLDVNMPGEDGLAIARRLRAAGGPPIMMLTAADDVVDRVVGLELGADDYVTKPFDLRELRARVRAVLRRSAAPAERAAPVAPGAAPAAATVPFGKVSLDLDARCLVDADGRVEPLTAMEFDLLHVLAQNPHRVLTRDRLLDLAHNRDSDPFDRSIDIRITRIRRKVEIDPSKPEVIKTVRGAGYIYVPPKRRP